MPDTLAAVLDFGEGNAPKSLRFHERFSLRNTDEKTVREGIRAMFGSAAGAHGKAGATQPKTSVEWLEKKAEGATKGPCAMRTAESCAARIASGAISTATTVGTMAKNAGKTTNATMTAITTMAELEEVVRERLGLCWMRRTGRVRKAA